MYFSAMTVTSAGIRLIAVRLQAVLWNITLCEQLLAVLCEIVFSNTLCSIGRADSLRDSRVSSVLVHSSAALDKDRYRCTHWC